MSPTVFHYRNYRFFFFSREEPRVHVHVRSPDGEAKFWLEPEIALADHRGFSQKELKLLEEIVREQKHEIQRNWHKHFQS